MFSVCVRDHVMIAHSFQGEVFGPAQRLHGATYIVDVDFRRVQLDADGLVVDIGLASEAVHDVLAPYAYQNLDDVEEFKGMNTTTEAMAKVIFDKIAAKIDAGALGPHASGLDSIKVTLHESHVAWAAYEGRLD